MKQINTLIIKVHNASGSVLSLMFVLWFFSGIVLIFEGFPHASRNERFMHLSEFTPQQFQNLQAPPAAFKGDITLEICNNKPVYRVSSGRKAEHTFDATTLQPLSSFSESYAKNFCESFNGSAVKEVKTMAHLDQWVPWSYYKPLLPFYKCYMNDPAHTVLYVSKKTGKIVQQTTRTKRWCARFGAIPHWIYFKQLRLSVGTWRIVVIILASLGILIALSGIYAGFIRKRKRKEKKGITPYKKGWYKWHHMLGLFFGLFVFTFILSGLISVTSIPHWMVGVKASEKQKIEWEQNLELTKHNNTTPSEIFTALEQKQGIRKIEWKTVFGQPQYRIYYKHYQIPVTYTLQHDTIKTLDKYSLDEIKKQAKSMFGALPFTAQIQPHYDCYYSASAMYYLPQPAYKIELDDAAKTWLFINPSNGDEVRRLTKNTRVRRWTYRFLHTLDIPLLKKHDGLRKTILVLLSLIGLALSISGLVLSLKWFKRTLRKFKNSNHKSS